MPLRSWILVVMAGLMVVMLAADAEAIIRRHDVSDSDYVVDPVEHPAIVDLLAPGDCIATLIRPEWLITAAHCATNLAADATITVGDAPRGVSAVEIPTTWADDTDDIALVRLATPVEGVTPIPLYRGDDERGQTVWFVGRGDTATGLEGQAEAAVDGQTRKASNTVANVDASWVTFIFHSPDDAEVTPREGISGDGDSGGPALLMTEDGPYVLGVSSYQDEGDHALGTYGVEEFYTRVSRYTEWVDDVLSTPQDAGGPDDASPGASASEDSAPSGAASGPASGDGCAGAAPLHGALASVLFALALLSQRRRCVTLVER